MPEREKILSVIGKLFECFDRDNIGTIPVEDAAHILRYMGQFPSEGELVEVVNKQLIDDSQSRNIPLPILEKLAVRLINDHEYQPDFADTLMEAFRSIDTDKLGYITVEKASQVLTAGATGFREREINEFLRFARDKTNPGLIYYEDYVSKLASSNTRHISRLWNVNN